MKKCPHCGKFLKTTSGLRRHITLMHKSNNGAQTFNDKDRRLLYHLRDVIAGHIGQQIKLAKKHLDEKQDADYGDCISELKKLFEKINKKNGSQ